ncbi:hypothetical protein [Inhella sp.]|uniref:hypothetical protein n=1 Tax=Inhella sp. TaxID=1921806 RepID=UPI0035B0DD70
MWRPLLGWLVASVLVHAVSMAPRPSPPSPERSLGGSWGRFQVRQAQSAPLAALNPPARAEAPAVPSARTAPPSVAVPDSSPAASTGPAWPSSAEWPFKLQWRGESGEAMLRWEQDGQRYRLRLERRSGGRELPAWQSEGRLGKSGLLPDRFWAGRAGRRAQTLQQFDAPEAHWPPGTQDRLSWLWHASMQAAAQGLRPGGTLELQVAGWRGELQTWLLQAEADPEQPHWLRLRRLGPEGSLLEQLLWLDPARGHRLVRLQVRFDDNDRWSLEALDTATPPPVGHAPPPGP